MVIDNRPTPLPTPTLTTKTSIRFTEEIVSLILHRHHEYTYLVFSLLLLDLGPIARRLSGLAEYARLFRVTLIVTEPSAHPARPRGQKACDPTDS